MKSLAGIGIVLIKIHFLIVGTFSQYEAYSIIGTTLGSHPRLNLSMGAFYHNSDLKN